MSKFAYQEIPLKGFEIDDDLYLCGTSIEEAQKICGKRSIQAPSASIRCVELDDKGREIKYIGSATDGIVSGFGHKKPFRLYASNKA